MKYEGGGLLLDINRILRCLIATEYLAGRTPFYITGEVAVSEPWRNFDLRSSWDEDKQAWKISVYDRTGLQIAAKSDVVPEADFEIISAAPLLLPPPSPNEDPDL